MHAEMTCNQSQTLRGGFFSYFEFAKDRLVSVDLLNMKLKLKLTVALFVLLFNASLGWSAEEPSAAPVTAVKRIGVDEYDKLRTDTNNVLLDVRSAAEFEKGRIPHAVNIDINSSKFTEKVAVLDTNKTYLVNCAVGMRSATACKKMTAMGFNKLYDLAPGFDGWKKAGKPIEK